jgi:hypothetical protein
VSDTPISVTVSDGDTAISGSGYGVNRAGDTGLGVYGASDVGTGVYGSSGTGTAVQGETASKDYAAVSANNHGGGPGVWAQGTPGGYFRSTGGTDAITCESDANAVAGISTSRLHSGVAGINDSGGYGVWGRGRVAGHFEGDAEVTGTLTVAVDIVLQNAGDVAERFALACDPQPGSVMVVDDTGRLQISTKAYDTRVAGVICGAGSLRTGLVLGQDTGDGPSGALALMGRVYCLADASRRPIRTGDLMTTASSPGRAMRASSRRRSRGAILGKALAPLRFGQGLVPILVCLQ